jgi:energy-coupling factor transporter ATP-binding protein EcfA2
MSADRGDARSWLKSNGYQDIEKKIDEVNRRWRKRGVRTRRNWWEVLAGDAFGSPKTVEGVEFPVLAAARRRQGLMAVDTAERNPGEAMPDLNAPEPPPQPRQHKETSGIRRTKSSEDAITLTVKNFAQIKDVSVRLEDLVVLVGPQATGKSLVLEILKLVIDRNRIVRSLRQHGYKWEKPEEFSGLYFGGGFEQSWTHETDVSYGQQTISLKDVANARASKGEDAVFYIPAHRTLAIAEGWPRPFTQYQVETPYVAKRFSEEILTSLNQGIVGKGKIFPHDRRLKYAFRRLIDEAVFHGATLRLDTRGMRKQFVLEYERAGMPFPNATLPFMAWTAGQREFTPMLLGLYHLLPAGGGPKKKEIHWAVLEEPEMGLHPKAVVAVMAVVLDLLARGYKVALSTHSPTVLEVVWGMSRLKQAKQGPALLCEMMGLPPNNKNVLRTASQALKKTYAVVHLQHDDDGRVGSTDISNLDPGAADQREWDWGGLTGFSARVADVVTKARR